MEEYIKILEEIVEIYRNCSVNEEGFDMKVDIGFTKKECEALETLIARYKELEEENTQLKQENEQLKSELGYTGNHIPRID